MQDDAYQERRRSEALPRRALEQHQLARLNALLATILPSNRFYAEKFGPLRLPLESMEQFRQLPFTTKDDLAGVGGSGAGAPVNLTYPIERYVRCHQTSGTRGRPLAVLDTAEDWTWWVDVWQYVLDAAALEAQDRVLMAFSFGPFIGFWSAFDAAARRGALVIPGGGLSSLARLEIIRARGVTAICCTPTYALRLAEVAAEHQINVATLGLKKIIVAGEPGGSAPATRGRLEKAWSCDIVDHAGASEIGPWGYSNAGRGGVHIVESEFIAEFIVAEKQPAAQEGELAELVLTTLGRAGAPVIRYRTGDLVRPSWRSTGGNQFVLLAGGVLGRNDDMMIIRGVNVFPGSIEQIVHGFPEVVEHRLTARRVNEMDELTVEIEDRLNQPERVAEELRLRLGLKVAVRCVPLGSLPRFEGKGRRFLDER